MRRFAAKSIFIIALTIAGLLPLFIALDRTPIPWIDEVLWVSTSLSVVNGHSATPSVLEAFPRTGRFDLFYGPVGIEIGAVWMKLAGVSAWNWRVLSFAGGVSVIVLAALLVSALGGSQLLAASAGCFVAFSSSVGGRINSGRLDTLTVAFELAALILLVLSMQRQGWRSYVYSACAGLGIASAALSTPRALTFCLGLAAAAILLVCLGWRKRIVEVFLPAAVVSTAALYLWIRSQALGPVAWARYIEHVAKGDSDNVTPLLGGSWGAQDTIYLPELAAPVLFAFVILCLGWIWIRESRRPKLGAGRNPELLFVLAVGTVNMLLSFALFSRALNYQVFFIVPVLVGLLVLSSIILEVNNSLISRRLLLALWLGFAALGVGMRAAKVAEFTQSWSSRDPRPILTFIKENIPANSTVLGLDACYFWAVQDSGSKYLWIEESTTPGLNSHSGFDADAVLTNSARHPVYLLWKRALPIPSGFSTRVVRKTASFEMPAGRGDLFSRFRHRIGGGYPPTELYELKMD
jgi:hypothetical protein